ncbi:hypothetical protein HYE82_12140 [Streptomyces sp. BR123]|uniref:hypothetical protein n=1 Tax=Streptomyces sp. BR123 TaxID=2749828 RepID=UPI0015C43B56|nr:hypothetical protein [Streptomyces sp. BR123]NXY95128.1 hypothetical protein [Streptomyces sp. BR123]
MHAFTPAGIQAGTALPAHAARTAELAAEAAAGHLAREAAPAPAGPAPVRALRNRLGEALVRTGNRLLQPGHGHGHARAAG